MKRNERKTGNQAPAGRSPLRRAAELSVSLGLCLLLTGCYIAPDDISNTGSYSTGGGSLPFQTLAPTATVEVTPDTVVIQTQNLFGPAATIALTHSGATATPDPGQAQQPAGPTPTPTPTMPPGSVGWNEWGTVPEVTEASSPGLTVSVLPDQTPQSSTIVFDTPTPKPGGTDTSAQNEATAAPKETIQVVTRPPATPTPTPKSLQRGFTGSDEVRALQKRLRQLGYYTGSADGDFGPGTEAAVKAFQRANGLTADGKAGEKTLEKLNSSDAISQKEANATPKPTAKATAKPTAKVTNTPRPTATPNLSKEYYLQAGASGKRVRTLQNRLIQLGYLGGKATGEYDEATEAAVRAFQKKTKGLWEDGVAGPDTLNALYSDSAAKASSMAASTGETLERGSEGEAVRALQRRLKELGYLSGTVDGSYGIATEAAVIAFQQRNGLTPDGKAGTATLGRLYSSEAIKNGGSPVSIGASAAPESGASAAVGQNTAGISSTGYVTLERDSAGEDVRRLQTELKRLGYYNGNVDGRYGEGTVAAVMAYQLRNNLTVDGKAGPATQRSLYRSGNQVAYSALRVGEEGTAVRNLQYTLYELGYYTGKVDGTYGETTADAVRAFQIQNKLSPVDGVAGSATLARLYSPEAVSASAAEVSYESSREGDRGELVAEIQDCLVQMGYLGKVTGRYDEETTEAIRTFQREHGLTPDGVAGERTLEMLFGY
ncbi:MAG: peptidoglycan-binding protein [Clostridia bacterium]|nr:peptidoglycan-binding protein [Clostridia bacterium]